MAERYKIYERLGAGGVGAVFRAYDSQLKRWVAIKRLLNAAETKSSDAETAELRREADALASLRNPNIVTIFDVASDEEGLFIVMELLEGEDLADVLRRGPLSFDDFKELASQTMEGLLAAHQKHILHRDIKPENIKIERLPGGRLQAKIIDFGLARAGLRARKQTEDQEGTVMGSIFYMAPEQLTREPVDARTDLYSMGCVYYEALSGRRAFDGDSMGQVVDKHIDHEVLQLNEIAPYVPPWLSAWCMRLISQKPDDRPVGAQQAIEEFRAWEKMPVIPPGPWMPMYYPPQAYPQPAYPPGSEYYQPPHDTSGAVPVAAQAVEEVAYATPVAEPPVARPGPRRASTPVPPGKRTSPLQAPPHSDSPQQTSSNLTKYLLIGGAAVVVLGGAFFFLARGKGTSDSGGKASESLIGPSGPPPVAYPLPTDRIVPAMDYAICMQFVASTGSFSNAKGADGKPAPANPGEPVLEWRDTAPRGNDNLLRSFESSADYSPRRLIWPAKANTIGAKPNRACLDFRLRNGVPSAMNLTDPEDQLQKLPFGSDSAWERGSYPRGLSLFVVLQADSSNLPTRVCTLSGEGGAFVSIKVDEKNNLVAEARGSGAEASAVSSGINASTPCIAAIVWSADTQELVLRGREASGKTFRGEPAKVTPPDKVLGKLQIGRVKDAAGQPVSAADTFSGYIGEVVVYSTAVQSSQADFLEGQLRDYYFQGPPKNAPAKKK